jgi:hypothetical protein
LYTKALALLGLGVLAVAGALVDYWPSSTNLPRPVNARVTVRDQVAAARSGSSLIDAVPSATTRPRAVVARAAVVTSATDTALPALAPVLIPSGTLGTTVPLAALTTDTLPVLVNQTTVAHTPSALPDESSAPAYTLVENPTAPVAPAVDRGDGLIFGDDAVITIAFRKTGASIQKASVKTGSSIAGAIRGFGGAVRRALPVL